MVPRARRVLHAGALASLAFGSLAWCSPKTLSAQPTPSDLPLRWKHGLSWKVEYSHTQPSAAAVAEPPDVSRKDFYAYSVARRKSPPGWLLSVRELRPEGSSPVGHQRFEVAFSTAYAVEKVMRFNHLNEGSEVFNDAETGGYRCDRESVPLLDWPDRSSGSVEGGSLVLRWSKEGYDAWTAQAVWERGKPWWTRAARGKVEARFFD